MFTIGSDPEVFVRKKLKNTTRIISAHDLVPGKKFDPHPLKAGGTVIADGTAVEFTIPPAKTSTEFARLLTKQMEEIKKQYLGKDFVFDFVPVRKYSPTVWAAIPGESKELGCLPEKFANGQREPRKDELSPWRGTGFHIHIGWTKDKAEDDQYHEFDCKQIVRHLANWYSCMNLHVDPYWMARQRRTGYGQSQAYRVKPYGVEYRALSGSFLGMPFLWKWLADTVLYICNEAVKADERYMTVPGDYRYSLDQWAQSIPDKAPQFPLNEYKEFMKNGGLLNYG